MVDPEQTVERMRDRIPAFVDGSNTRAPQHTRKVILWSEGMDEGSQYALSAQAKNVLLHILGEGVRGITFARSMSEVNDTYRSVKTDLREVEI
jgi:hypothetical protein